MEEEKQEPIQSQAPAVDVEKIVQGLREQGLKDEQIAAALDQMVKEGKMAQEDAEKAKMLLKKGQEENPENEEKEAERLFGMKFI